MIRNARFVTEEGRTFVEYEPLDVPGSVDGFIRELWRHEVAPLLARLGVSRAKFDEAAAALYPSTMERE